MSLSNFDLKLIVGELDGWREDPREGEVLIFCKFFNEYSICFYVKACQSFYVSREWKVIHKFIKFEILWPKFDLSVTLIVFD